MSDYREFLDTKRPRIKAYGKPIQPEQINPMLFPFQKDVVQWACYKGRAGVFLDTGAKVTVPASNLLCKWDAASVTPGAHVIRMTAIVNGDPVWGTQESVQSAPLNFTRPTSPTVPSTPRLSAQ